MQVSLVVAIPSMHEVLDFKQVISSLPRGAAIFYSVGACQQREKQHNKEPHRLLELWLAFLNLQALRSSAW